LAARGIVPRTFYIETFGCQMNVHDSEKVRGLLESQGYSRVSSPDDASMLLYNTCSIQIGRASCRERV